MATAVAVMTLIGPILGVLPDPPLPETALLALAVFRLLTIGGGLIRLLGHLSARQPGLRGGERPELLPTPWAEAGGWLTRGGAQQRPAALAYFDGAHLAKPLAALASLTLLGIAIEALAERYTTTASATSV